MNEKVYATMSLSHRTASGGDDMHRVVFSVTASKLFDGCDYVRVRKSDDYLIFVPLREWEAGFAKAAIPFHRIESGRVVVSCTRLVNTDGWLPAYIFDGKRHNVKRDKKGRVYVCLKEVVPE